MNALPSGELPLLLGETLLKKGYPPNPLPKTSKLKNSP